MVIGIESVQRCSPSLQLKNNTFGTVIVDTNFDIRELLLVQFSSKRVSEWSSLIRLMFSDLLDSGYNGLHVIVR